ncbi:MAG TPA: C40 family peptidase [Quisquiliibacterium sp.]|nr:C40 family peptidase [Quisquiliibacterium sp.]
MPTSPPARSRVRHFAQRASAAVLVAAFAAFYAPPAAMADPAPEQHPAQSLATDLVVRALDLLGVNYKWGGNSPETGLDCSGLVRHVFAQAAGLVLPRRSEEISRAGAPIARSELRPGDLVFFNTLRRTFSHVGIYIGDGRFVHAPSRGGQVRVENLAGSYWASRFNGGRRLIDPAEAGAPAPVFAAGLTSNSASAAVSAAAAAVTASLPNERLRQAYAGQATAGAGTLTPATARESTPFAPHGSF